MQTRPRPDRSEFGGLDIPADEERLGFWWSFALLSASALVSLAVLYGLGRLLLAVL